MRNALAQVRARRLRQQMTDAERKLWYHLRRGQLGGCRFRRNEVLLETDAVLEVILRELKRGRP